MIFHVWSAGLGPAPQTPKLFRRNRCMVGLSSCMSYIWVAPHHTTRLLAQSSFHSDGLLCFAALYVALCQRRVLYLDFSLTTRVAFSSLCHKKCVQSISVIRASRDPRCARLLCWMYDKKVPAERGCLVDDRVRCGYTSTVGNTVDQSS